MVGTLRVRRSRGAFSGALLVLLGLWGGLAPMIGPQLHFAYTPDRNWAVTSGRVWLEFIPAAVVIVGGLMMMASRLRPWALLGASMAIGGGGWFALGSVVARLWMHTPPAQGTPIGGPVLQALEQLAFFTGLGAVIIFLASVALGRLSVISVRDASLADRTVPTGPVQPVSEPLPVREPLPDSERIPFDDDPEPTAQLRKPTSSTAKTPMATLARIASRNKPVKESGDDTSASDDSPTLSRTGSSS